MRFASIIARSGGARGDIPVVLSTTDTRGCNIVCSRGDVIATFGRTNFHALIVTGRGLAASVVKTFCQRTSAFVSVDAFGAKSCLASLCSTTLLPCLRGRLSGSSRSVFVILRACKSRFGCRRHCPTRFQVCAPSGTRNVHRSCGGRLHGTCSGSVHCASCILKRVISVLGGGRIYTSVLCLDSRKRSVFSSTHTHCLRTSPVPACCRLRVPCVV